MTLCIFPDGGPQPTVGSLGKSVEEEETGDNNKEG